MDQPRLSNQARHLRERLDPRRSIRAQVALVIGGIVLALSLLLSLVSGQITVQQTIQDRGRFLASLAQEHSIQLSRTMFERWREIQNLSLFGPFREPGISNDTVRSFLEIAQVSYPNYSWIGWVAPDGEVLSSTGSLLEGVNISERPWFQQALQGPYVGDVHEAVLLAQLLSNSSAASLRFVDVATPVYRDGTLLGVIGAHLDWRWNQEITNPPDDLSHMNTAGGDIEILIVNSEGVIVSGPPRFQAQLMADLPRFAILDALGEQLESDGNFQIIQWPDEGAYLTGYHRETGYMSYPGLGWLVIVRQPTTTAFAPAFGLQQRIMTVGLLSAAVFAWIGWRLATRATRPLVSMADAVRDVQDSTLDLALPQSPRKDEVGVLAQAIQTLMTRLRARNVELETLNATLEQQVSERTAAAESRTLALSQEIRIRQAIEESLRESEKRFRILAESSFEGLVVLSGRAIMDVNPALVTMFGYDSPSEVVSMNLLELTPVECHDLVLEHIQSNSPEPYEALGRRNDGSLFPVEIRGQSLASPEIELRVIAIRDLTRIKQAEEATRKRLDQMAALRRVDIELSARLDLGYVLNFALDSAMRLSNATVGSISLLENGQLSHALVLGAPAPAPPVQVDEGVVVALFAEKMPRRFTRSAPGPAAFSLLRERATAQMLFPLYSADRLLGVLSLETNQRDGFDDETFQFIQLVVGRITVAIDNARLYEASQQQLAQVSALSETLAYQAEHDSLTGLANRALFEQRLTQALDSARRHAGIVAAGYVDLDHFKQVNDKLGHGAGDELLRQVARRLLASVPDGGAVARVGGDEFALYAEVETPAQAEEIAAALVAAMSETFNVLNHALVLTCSVGFSLFPFHTQDQQLLLRYADTALYQAKLSGRNAYAIYDPAAGGDNVTQYAALEHDLIGAISRGEMVLHFQPQLDLEANDITGVEALTRWQHPRYGLISPRTLIPIAEETGLIVELGDWVLREACRHCMAWHQAGYEISVAVNVSAVQLERVDFVERTIQIIEESGLSPWFVELEITESLFMYDFELKVQTLHRLRDHGLRLAIDDFGTGFSSLNYLRQLPVSILKIDRSFISDLAEGNEREARAYAIIEAIVTMAHALDMSVIAEGVEHEYQVEALRSLKSNGLQGYLLSRPMPAGDITPLLAAHAQRRAL